MSAPATNQALQRQTAVGSLKPSFWANLFRVTSRPRWSLELHSEGLRIQLAEEPIQLPYASLESISIQDGLLFSGMTIAHATRILSLRGSWRGQTHAMVRRIRRRRSLDIVAKLEAIAPQLRLAVQDWATILNGDAYLADYEVRGWIERWSHLGRELQVPESLEGVDRAMTGDLQLYRVEPSVRRQLVARRNQLFVAAELRRYERFFDSVGKDPLTNRQRKAVVTNEDHTLVVAGAGSGKTSAVVAKLAYLVNRGLASPSEILLLAFTNKAAQEMRSRLTGHLEAVNTSTFHALGKKILADVEGTSPSLARWANDAVELRSFVGKLFQNLVSSSQSFANAVCEFFLRLLTPYRSELECNTLGEYIQYIKGHDLRSLKGERLRSFEECQIANYLNMNGIAYEYERRYEHDTATTKKQQYRPDFFLSEHGIYIEHFGVRRDGSTAPWVDRDQYWKSIRWKRALHRTHGTELVETYSYQQADGTLLSKLGTELAERGVPSSPRSEKEVLAEFNRVGAIRPFEELLSTFLRLFKARSATLRELDLKSDGSHANRRLRGFTRIFEALYRCYEEELRESRTIDFDDMILRATDHVQNNAWRSPYRYVLVDEFQDIATNRFALLKALLDQHAGSRSFCVGDDWQAIYRFAGGDLSIMTAFADHFGFTKTVMLDQTFRFPERLAALSSRFILCNPAQTAKVISAQETGAEPPVVLVYEPSSNQSPGNGTPASGFLRAVEDIRARHSADDQPEVLVIGRYHRSKPSEFDAVKKTLSSIEYLTVHKAKGLEADYVIVVGLDNGHFPNEKQDDPILDLVKSSPEAFANAEERRVFYVALTRAKRRVYLVASRHNPSKFVVELEEGDYDIVHLGDVGASGARCTKCKVGHWLSRRGPGGVFLGCSNYPYCDETSQACPSCSLGHVQRQEPDTEFRCSNCDKRFYRCLRCTGYMVERQHQAGAFLGCSNYGSGGCRYTLNLRPPCE